MKAFVTDYVIWVIIHVLWQNHNSFDTRKGMREKLDDLKAGANCDFQKTIDEIEVNKLGAKKTHTHTIQDLLSFCNYRFSSAQQVIMLITCYIAYVQVCILFTSAILL